jgi:hypothetical protein
MSAFHASFWRRPLRAAVLLLFTPALLVATIILPRDLGAMASASTDIIRGKVVSMESRWNDDKTLIVTDVQLQVTEVFKGKAAPQATLELLGGRVEEIALDVVGSPSFALGEDVVVFATAGKDGRLRLPSLAQEKFTVEESAGGKAWVRNDQQAFGSLLPGETLALDADGRLAWEEFRARLVKALEREGGAQ